MELQAPLRTLSLGGSEECIEPHVPVEPYIEPYQTPHNFQAVPAVAASVFFAITPSTRYHIISRKAQKSVDVGGDVTLPSSPPSCVSYVRGVKGHPASPRLSDPPLASTVSPTLGCSTPPSSASNLQRFTGAKYPKRLTSVLSSSARRGAFALLRPSNWQAQTPALVIGSNTELLPKLPPRGGGVTPCSLVILILGFVKVEGTFLLVEPFLNDFLATQHVRSWPLSA